MRFQAAHIALLALGAQAQIESIFSDATSAIGGVVSTVTYGFSGIFRDTSLTIL